MVTSFADGSKISFEQSIVANATGFTVLDRGMSRGLEYRGDVMEIGSLYDVDQLRELGGVVDYVVGTPLTKVYCLAEHTDPKQQHYLELYKMGKGPLYSFFIPYHLVHFEVPFAIARAVLFRDSVAKPLAGPTVEVCAVAKRDLEAGETLDQYGMYTTYGEAAATAEMSERRYLPEGLAVGCTLRRDIPKDAVLTYDDVDVPARQVGGPPARRAAGAVQGRVVALRPAFGFGAADNGRHEGRHLLRRPRRADGRGNPTNPEADDPDRQPADPVAHHALLLSVRAYRVHPVPRYKGDVIKEYFLGYNEALFNDFVLDGYGGDAQVEILNRDVSSWKITFADTGMQATIGERLKAIEPYLGDDEVFLALTATGCPTSRSRSFVRTFERPGKMVMFALVRPHFHAHIVEASMTAP